MFEAYDISALSRFTAQLQLGLNYRSRSALAQALIDTTNQLLPETLRSAPSGSYDTNANLLKSRGLADLGQVLDASQIEAVLRHFLARPCFPGHVAGKSDGRGRTIQECAGLSQYASYHLADVLAAPFLLELANRDDILGLAESYLGCVPSIYAANAVWSFPAAEKPWPGIQTFHRDFDDFRFCTLFVFITPTSPEDGAHYYIRGTHRTDVVEQIFAEKKQADLNLEDLFRENADIEDACKRLFADRIETVSPPAGGAVLEDTYGLHKGDIPKNPRLLFWVRYGLYRNLTNQRDQIQPVPRAALEGRVPDTPRHRYINRMIVES